MPVDERVYGPPPFREFVYRSPCVVVGCETRDRRTPSAYSVIELCHIGRDGIARKGPWRNNIYPGCWRHHREEGDCGVLTFAERHELAVHGVSVRSLREAAIETTRQYEAHDGGLAE